MQQVGATDDAHRRVQGFLGLVHAELSGERFDEVDRLAQVGLDYAVENGFRLMAAKFQNCLGECARMRGDLKAAMTHYRTTISRFEAIGVRDWAAQLNLGLVFLGEGSIHEARRIFEGFTHRQEAGIRRMALPTALLGLALCEITQAKWSVAEDHVIEAQRILSTTGQRDRDLIILSEQIAEQSTQADQGRLALLLRRLQRINSAVLSTFWENLHAYRLRLVLSSLFLCGLCMAIVACGRSRSRGDDDDSADTEEDNSSGADCGYPEEPPTSGRRLANSAKRLLTDQVGEVQPLEAFCGDTLIIHVDAPWNSALSLSEELSISTTDSLLPVCRSSEH